MSSARMKRYVPLAQRFAARVVLFHEAVAARLGLHATDVKVLRLLGERAMAPGELAAEIGLTAAAVTALLDRLEKPGYLKREPDAKDRRKVLVRAVPSKLRRLDKLYDGQAAAMEAQLGLYNQHEFDAIADYLERAAGALAAETARLREGKRAERPDGSEDEAP